MKYALREKPPARISKTAFFPASGGEVARTKSGPMGPQPQAAVKR